LELKGKMMIEGNRRGEKVEADFSGSWLMAGGWQ
jgi:hypothetical protein